MATDAQREKRRLILRAAVTVFARKGYHGARVSDVATEAGVAYGLVYHYFGKKEDLLETIFRRTWARMLGAVEAVEEGDLSAREQLAAVAKIVLGSWETDPDLISVLVREITRTPQLGREVDEIELAFAALERIIKRGQERGELKAGLDSRIAAQIVYGALEEILTGWVFDPEPTTSDDVVRAERTVVALLADGLAVD